MLDLIILGAALLVDLLFGEPPVTVHPVVWCGKISRVLYKPYASRIYGIVLWATSVLPILVPIVLIACILRDISIVAYVAFSAYFLKTSFSIKMLRDIVKGVHSASSLGNWDSARKLTQQIVRRNVYELDEEHVLSAAIESLAESLVDGITSPLFYYPFLGLTGAMLQRLANTMDSMVGYTIPEYRRVGWFSARLDDLLNYIPARLTAYLIVISAYLLGYDWRNSLRTIRLYARTTASINAGYPMSAMAGALRVKLEKPGYYSLGDPIDRLTPNKVADAIRVFDVTVILYVLLVALLTIITPSILP